MYPSACANIFIALNSSKGLLLKNERQRRLQFDETNRPLYTLKNRFPTITTMVIMVVMMALIMIIPVTVTTSMTTMIIMEMTIMTMEIAKMNIAVTLMTLTI